MIDALINKQDNFEIVRDKIATILANEQASQQALATAAAQDPDLWKLRVYIERSNPWQALLNDQSDRSPIVNVMFENSNFEERASNVVERQKCAASFNIDIYGYGRAQTDGGAGHLPGDEQAARTCQRGVRLVRNILMADSYTYLDLRGTVWQRWPQSITQFQPQIDANQAQQIVAARLVLRVIFNEFSPQITPETIDEIFVDINRAEDGQLIAEADYVYTP